MELELLTRALVWQKVRQHDHPHATACGLRNTSKAVDQLAVIEVTEGIKRTFCLLLLEFRYRFVRTSRSSFDWRCLLGRINRLQLLLELQMYNNKLEAWLWSSANLHNADPRKEIAMAAGERVRL